MAPRREYPPLALLQIHHDLRAVALEPALPIPAAVEALGPDLCAQYRASQAARRVPAASSGPLHDALWMAASSPDEDATGACIATAALLADAFETPNLQEDWLWVWEALGPALRSAPAPVRAALANGFREARKMGLAHDDVRPTEDDCHTQSAATVIAGLLPLVKNLDPEERRLIASADRYSKVKEHLDPLEALLARPNCHLGPGEAYHPAEAVELVAFAPKHLCFAAATALLLIWSLQDEDYVHGSLDGRWFNFHRTYKDLPHPWQRPILAGFRHVYEATGTFWQPWIPSVRKRSAEGWDGKLMPWHLDP